MITPATHYISEDEPCFQLREIDNVPVPPKGRPRRYRTLVVVRNDGLAEYMEDMGLSSKQKFDQCRILGGVIDEQTGRIFIEHSVGDLRTISEQLKKHKVDKAALIGVDRVKNP